jgi:hypothetical protein
MKNSFRNMNNSPSGKCVPGNSAMRNKADNLGNVLSSQHKTEQGVVLVMVLVLSAVALAIMTALIYMTTIGTQTSGMQKRYHSALEAGIAGKDVIALVITQRGDLSSLGNLSPVATVSTCTGTSVNTGMTYTTDISAKIMTSTIGPAGTGWSSGCNSYLKIDPLNATTYDLKFTLGTNPTYTVFAKIVDTVEGNTGGSNNAGGNKLTTQAVVSGSSGEVTVMSIPYLYTIEIDAENANSHSNERAKLQVLYQN